MKKKNSKSPQFLQVQILTNGKLEGGFEAISIHHQAKIIGGETTNNCYGANCIDGCGPTNSTPGCGGVVNTVAGCGVK